MSFLAAGLATGALMAQTFIMIGCLTAFFLLKNPPPHLKPILTRIPPGTMVLGMVAAAYPLWGIVGIVLSFLFLALQNGFPGSGLGSANLVYTVGVTCASVALSVPILILLREVRVGISCIALSAVLIFGWLLPLLAT